MTDDEKRKAKVEYMRKRRAENPERCKEIQQRFKDTHPGYYTEYYRKWRDAHREHVRTYQREYARKRRAAAKAALEAAKAKNAKPTL